MAGNGQNYTLRLNLSGFIGSRIVALDNADGISENGIFIPIDINGLYVDPNYHNVMCEAYVNARAYSADNKTHSLKLKYSKAHAEKMKSLGYTNPSLGHMWLRATTTKYQCAVDALSRVKFNQD